MLNKQALSAAALGLLAGLPWLGVLYLGGLESGNTLAQAALPALIAAIVHALLAILLALSWRRQPDASLPRVTLAALAAGASAAIAWGLGARLMMRVMALLAGHTPGFSLVGTIGIMLVALLTIGIPGGLLYATLQRFIPGPGALKGILFSLALFALGVIVNPARREVESVGALWPVAAAGFALVFLAYGLLLGALFPRLLARRATAVTAASAAA